MKIKVLEDQQALGREAAQHAARVINETVSSKGKARIVMSTGASQFSTIENLIGQDIAWDKVEMFHLDEYIDLPADHPASFRRYLKERFTSKVDIGKVHFVEWEGGLEENMRKLSEEIKKEPVELGLIGIGQNAHLAFNDPPADFETEAPFIIVNLDESCKKQQVGEGWFPDAESVPSRAVTMTVKQIMSIETIICPMPYKVKAEAIRNVLEEDITRDVPATILKRHENVFIYLDRDSASLLREDVLKKYS